MKLRKKSEARLGSVSLACFRDSDCGDRTMNDFLPALSLRAILYYLNTWNNLVSRVRSYSAPAEREKTLATRLRLEQATISGKSR